MLTEQAKKQLDDLLAKYPNAKSAVLPALHVAQDDQGHLGPEVILEVADRFGLTPGDVEGVVTFYTMYHKRPTGRHLLQVCTNISCSLMGANHIVDHIGSKLGIKAGETTPDGRFTLQTVECLGTCGTAPVMQINETFYENLTPEKVDELLEELK